MNHCNATDPKSSLSQCELQDLFELIAMQGGVLKSHQVLSLMTQHAVSFDTIKEMLLPVCELFAIAPISKFHAGAIAQGQLTDVVENTNTKQQVANLYFGANLEFAGEALNLTVHAEQAAINNAWHHGESKITAMVINAAPCGFCRQFINEVRDARLMPMNIAGKSVSLDDLLPDPFSPEVLGSDVMLFDTINNGIAFTDIDKDLLHAVNSSYAPYTKNPSAVMIECHGDTKFIGRYAENCAYNPSLSPLQSALSIMALHGLNPNKHPIKRITLAEVKGQANQLGATKNVLTSLPQGIEFVHLLGEKV
ncbi:cytidine deaminase [Psychrosphaera aestuarii]|uniref:cytidine deaminase n=1 Tax=Psychrosphaera aestuarii TaxID=1266052 RepID=UPI001B3257DB|nr:cytidine deaminase [Psychrosphaera aestuarii]